MSIAKKLLKHRSAIFEELYTKEHSFSLSLQLLLISFAGLAIYGIAMGTFHNDPMLWIVMGGKLLLVLFGSVLLAVPTLYTILSMRGSRSSFVQVLTLIFGALATTGLIMLSLVPIVWFFTLSTQSLYILILMNLFMVGFSVLFGLIFLVQGVVYENKNATTLAQTGAAAILFAWVVLTSIVSLQMMYNLRPFFHQSEGYAKITLEEKASLDDIRDLTSDLGLVWICEDGDSGCLEYFETTYEQPLYDADGRAIESNEKKQLAKKDRKYFYAIMPYEFIESEWKKEMEEKDNIIKVEFVPGSTIDKTDRTEDRFF